ncbi:MULTISPECIES: hypothetical protein [Catenuloplanes]|uniref:Uncharacterized protein n=1 Tax=Catenuloplanes niger TaxID=587534 RepID=A0AAE3ZUG2_9ACTN|nr:hypothetical protein [Catenuloplanes niger]MDR7326298.1 hypothetical protein [Catenuloplanes niger]
MSLLEELGARIRATNDELPVGLVLAALERLRVASELLAWVRQASSQPMGVPQLANATEHAEHAAFALRSAQDAISEYLAAIGLSHDATRGADGSWRDAVAFEERDRPQETPQTPDAAPLGRWWKARVTVLTGGEASEDESAGAAGGPGRATPGERDRHDRDAATDSADLLRRVAASVGSDSPGRMRRELGEVEPPVGLGLAALSPALLHRLTADLLGHEPRPEDLPRVRKEAEQLRELLPGLPANTIDVLAERVCRVPPEQRRSRENDSGDDDAERTEDGRRRNEAERAHPADAAVAGAVLTGVLLKRLGRDPGSLNAAAPETVPTYREPDADG